MLDYAIPVPSRQTEIAQEVEQPTLSYFPCHESPVLLADTGYEATSSIRTLHPRRLHKPRTPNLRQSLLISLQIRRRKPPIRLPPSIHKKQPINPIRDLIRPNLLTGAKARIKAIRLGIPIPPPLPLPHTHPVLIHLGHRALDNDMAGADAVVEVVGVDIGDVATVQPRESQLCEAFLTRVPGFDVDAEEDCVPELWECVSAGCVLGCEAGEEDHAAFEFPVCVVAGLVKVESAHVQGGETVVD